MSKPLLPCVLAACALLLGQTRPLDGYALEGPSWPSGTAANPAAITMNLQLSSATYSPPYGFPLTDGNTSWNAVAEEALGEWNQYLSTVQFVYNTNTSITPTEGDGINTVFFSSAAAGYDFGSDAIAVTLLYYHKANNTWAEADVVVNTAEQWDSYRGPLQQDLLDGVYTYDLRRVLDHEFGHVLGLDHPDQAGQTVVAIMNSQVSDLDHIEMDDINGVMSLYGQKTVPESITVVANPTNGGTVTGSGTFALGSTQVVTATPAAGYDFVQWEDGSTDATRSVTIPVEGATYTATFAQFLDDWRYRTVPQLYTFFTLFYVKNQFYLFTEAGVATSPDGTNWSVDTASTPEFSSVVYGNGIFVGISGATVYTSTDGVTWTSSNALIGGVEAIAFGNGIFVVTGSTTNSSFPAPVMYSTDGVSWTTATTGLAGYNLGAITYGNGQFVALGTNSGADDFSLVSTDGAHWVTSDLSAPYGLNIVAYGNGVFVASGGSSGFIYHSRDGLSWTGVNPNEGPYDNAINSIAYGNGNFIAICPQWNLFLNSTDGVTWTERTHPSGYPVWYKAVFGNNSFVALDELGVVQSGTLPPVATQAPAITSSLASHDLATSPYDYQIVGSNGPTAYNAFGLPAGLSINHATGEITGTPTAAGTYHVTLFATNDAGSGSATLTLTISMPVPPQAYSSWAMTNGVSGLPTDTPKGDAVPNLMKYFYDISPTGTMKSTDRSALPVLATASAGSMLTLTYRQNQASLTEVAVTVQSSTDMANWSTPDGAQIVSTGNYDGTTGDPIMQAQVPVTSAAEFIRISVTPK